METTKELKITIPEGHEIDWQESAKQEKIVLKKIDNKPRSWEEYCKRTVLGGQSYIHYNGWIDTISEYNIDKMDEVRDRMVLPSKKLAEAFLAMMQLMSLREAWIGDWKPDWNEVDSNKYCIEGDGNYEFRIIILSETRSSLSFPTAEMATDFMNCFKDLLETAKPLI